jgi:hypothetical protein
MAENSGSETAVVDLEKNEVKGEDGEFDSTR